jgi:hypothetical protein
MAISRRTVASILTLALVLVGIPTLVVWYEARRTGRSVRDYLADLSETNEEMLFPPAARGPKIVFLDSTVIGDNTGPIPWITHLSIVDLDRDGLLDVLVCDAKLKRVSWIQQKPAGTYTEQMVGSEIAAPAHVTPSDIDLDGDLDLLVAEMGMIVPNNDKIGAVVVLENTGNEQFANRILVDRIARVTDIQPGDFDGDGDIDLAVGQFGYDDGEIRWMENHGNWEFESHNLLNLSGTVHTPVGDFDGDGDLDIAALVSQEWESVYVFENRGSGRFKARRIFHSANEDYGSSGLSLVDLDQDGDSDLLYTNGDAFDYIPPSPRPWHGIQWLENTGNLEFQFHRIDNMRGAFSPNAVDIDRDGDLDVVAVSAFNDWTDPSAQSMMWFENDGRQQFTAHDLLSSPSHLLVLDHGDMDGDGWVDLVSGGLYSYPPFSRVSRVALWHNRWPEREVLEQTVDSSESSSTGGDGGG